MGPDVSVDDQRARLRAWVHDRTGAEPAAMRETHVSILAFTDSRVWKCKKAVTFPFVDLATVDRRRANCEREVALNRRLAPDVYVGVDAVVDDSGRVVDHVVEMRRMPDDRRLAAIATRSDAFREVDELVELLVRFHATAATGGAVDASATVPALRELWDRGVAELRPFAGAGGLIDPTTLERVASDAGNYLAGRDPLFGRRIAAGRIRDGHGDLLADDVFCLPDGPRVLDCLEFDDRLRFGDVLADVAFLAMDLERLGRADLAGRLLDGYRDASGDDWPDSLAHFSVAYRALVRCKVACLRASSDPAAGGEAGTLLALAAAHLDAGRVRLVLVGGPPATGKSTVARGIAGATGWPVVRSDEVRKQLAGLAATARAAAPVDRGLYDAAWSDRTYAALLADARAHLEAGRSVIVDASWPSAARRAEASRLATSTASELTAFVCDVAPAIADARATARQQAGDDASDASAAVTAALRARFEPWPGAIVLDTAGPLEPVLAAALAHLGHVDPPAG